MDGKHNSNIAVFLKVLRPVTYVSLQIINTQIASNISTFVEYYTYEIISFIINTQSLSGLYEY